MARLEPAYRYRTAAFVRLHARRRPDHVAVLGNGRAVTYAMLDRDLRAMIWALQTLGLAKGAVAAVGHDDVYVQMLVVFGFEALGIVTGSFRPGEGEACHALLRTADLTMIQESSAGALAGAVRRLFVMTDDWVAAALSGDVPPMEVTPAPLDEPALVLRSSGTTGQPKRMLATHRVLWARANGTRATRVGVGRRSRFLVSMHFSAGIMQARVALYLQAGATVIYQTTVGMAETLAATRPTETMLAPVQIGRLLGELPAAGPGPLLPELAMVSMGAKLTAELRRQALARICGGILDAYGANEVGGICRSDETDSGKVADLLEVEVVGPDGEVLAVGETGMIRARGPAMVNGYVDDPVATAAMFRDGWFYPGDLARFVAPGRLQVVGRRGDVLNIGGSKLGCAELEGRILAMTRVDDVALVQRSDSDPLVYVCVVADDSVSLPDFARAIAPILPFRYTIRRLLYEIPRTAAGKIRRGALADLVFSGNASPREALLTTDL